MGQNPLTVPRGIGPGSAVMARTGLNPDGPERVMPRPSGNEKGKDAIRSDRTEVQNRSPG